MTAFFYYVSEGQIVDPPANIVFVGGRPVTSSPFTRPYMIGSASLGADDSDAMLAERGVYRLVVIDRGDPPALDYLPVTGELAVDTDLGQVTRTDSWRQMTPEEYAQAIADLKSSATGSIVRDARLEALALRAVAEITTDPVVVMIDGALEEMTPAEALEYTDAALLAAYQEDLIRWGRIVAAETAETLEEARGANQEPTAWTQPAGAHDAYALGTLVLHGGSLWQSTVAANVWEPGVSGWRNLTAVSPTGYPPWVQPTGAHDAYQIGDRVTHAGQNWESNTANNVWEPGLYGWVVI